MSRGYLSIEIELEVDDASIAFLAHEDNVSGGSRIKRKNAKKLIAQEPLIKKVVATLNKLTEADPSYLSYKTTNPALLSRVLNLFNQIHVSIKTSQETAQLNNVAESKGPLEFAYPKNPDADPELHLTSTTKILRYDIKSLSFLANHVFIFNHGTCFIQQLDDDHLPSQFKSFLSDINTPSLNQEEFLNLVSSSKLTDQIKLIQKTSSKKYIKSLTLERSLFKLKSKLNFSYKDFNEYWEAQDANLNINLPSGITFKRCLKTEKSIEDELSKQGFYQSAGYWNLNVKNPDQKIMALQSKGWKIFEHDQKKGNTEINYLKGQLKFRISYNIDWLDITGSVNYGKDTIPLESLIQSLRKNKNTVKLSNNRAGVIPQEWKAELENFLEDFNDDTKSIQIPKEKVGKLTTIFTEKHEVQYDQKSQELVDRILNFEKIAVIDSPPNLKATLRGYQQSGISWLNFLDEFNFSGLLADDMGLGKTIQVLTHLLRKKNKDEKGKFLIVMPKSLLFNWQDEIQKFTPSLKAHTYHGSKRNDDILKSEFDIILTTYGTLRSSFSLFQDISFNMIILDESQAIKNPTTKTFKAITSLKAKSRLCMTGTPIENHLGELWAQFKFLAPDLLGSKNHFEKMYLKNPKNSDLLKLRSLIFPFILRRKKNEVAKDLPEKVEQSIYCEMDKEQELFYNQLKESIKNELMSKVSKEGLNKSKIVILEALLRLRQAACHTKLVQKNAEVGYSGKLQTLIEMVSEIISEGHKVLIFSQFTSMLHIIKDELNKNKIPLLYLDGSTNNRGDLVREFQASKTAQAFLISLKAGGVGLNLTAAEYIFIFDPWWNPAAEMQAIDRAHRIGQKNTVFAYKLIAKNTIEEKIIKLQDRKKALVDQIITSEKSLMKDLTNDDLQYLFS